MSLLDIASVLAALRMRDRSVPVDERLLYSALLILVLTFAANAVTATAATVLLRTRNWRHIAYVCAGLGASAALAAATPLQRVIITRRDIPARFSPLLLSIKAYTERLPVGGEDLIAEHSYAALNRAIAGRTLIGLRALHRSGITNRTATT